MSPAQAAHARHEAQHRAQRRAPHGKRHQARAGWLEHLQGTHHVPLARLVDLSTEELLRMHEEVPA